MKHAKNNGFVLVITLLLITFLTVIMQQLMRQTTIFGRFSAAMLHKEQAYTLAQSTLAFAQEQLIRHLEKKDKEKDAQKQEQEFVGLLLPHLNTWQVFDLTEKEDGIKAHIRFCITSEHGKINLNESFDFKKGEFKQPIEDILKRVLVIGKTNLGEGELLKKLAEFLKKRNRKLDDISELLAIKELQGATLFYLPPPLNAKKDELEEKRPIALADVFTIETNSETIEPLLLSDGMCEVLGLKRPTWNKAETMKNEYKQFAQNFKAEMGKQWSQKWNLLTPFYGKEPQNFQNIQKIFSQQFAPQVYSVICYANVSDSEAKLVAVLKKKIIKKETEQDGKKEGTPSRDIHTSSVRYEISKTYWV